MAEQNRIKKFSQFQDEKRKQKLAPAENELSIRSTETPVETNITNDFMKNQNSTILKQEQSTVVNSEKQKARVPKMERTMTSSKMYPGDHSGDWDGKMGNAGLNGGQDVAEQHEGISDTIPRKSETEWEAQKEINAEREKNAMNENANSSAPKQKVKRTGKLAKFPENTPTATAVSFLENIKIPKKDIWYILVEKQDNELQMVKYNYKVGVHLVKFVADLKNYYTEIYKDDANIVEAISKIVLKGDDKVAIIQNISSNIKIGDRKLISLFTEDLVKLLSK